MDARLAAHAVARCLPCLRRRRPPVRRLGALALALVLLAGLAPASAQTPPMDFSDAERPLVDWPFQVIEYWVEADGLNIFQHSRVQEPPEQVYEYFIDLKSSRGQIGRFIVSGVSRRPEAGQYTIALTEANVKYMLQIKPDGAGSILTVKSTPNAIVTGYFKRALYDYRLGSELRVPVDRWDQPGY